MFEFEGYKEIEKEFDEKETLAFEFNPQSLHNV